MKKIIFWTITYLLFPFLALAQITCGTISNSSNSIEGYTLFAPNSDTAVYLIDNCGYLVNKWTTSSRPGLSAYLLEDGSLLKTAQTNNPIFTQGGSGGKLERYDWNGNLTWEFYFSDSSKCQHHDIEYLPNGNVLILATERITGADAIAQGRNPALLQDGELWSEMVVEIQPVGTNFGVIVWEWHAWDHLVQDFDNTKPNFGSINSNPQLFNLNYVSGQAKADWLHCNAVAYNADLDQIVLSSKTWSELWVIDHSTSSSQAAGNNGGNSGKGGDILYRWGNPLAYGVNGTKMLYDQHDVHWIPNGNPDAGKLMIFNNGDGRGFSSIDIIAPPVDTSGNYTLTGTSFGPTNLHWTYQDPSPTNFYSQRISGAQQLPNGNTLICSGQQGYFFEVDNSGNKVWEYINPVTNNGISSQGQNPTANAVFRAYRYLPSYLGFVGKNLTPTVPIELNPNTNHCALYSSTDLITKKDKSAIKLYPNPSSNIITIESNTPFAKIQIYNILGKLVRETFSSSSQTLIDVKTLAKGTYFVKVANESVQFIKY